MPLDITGHYDLFGEGFSILDRSGTLAIVQAGVPDDFHPTLTWVGDDEVVVHGGPFSGVRVTFTAADGVVSGATAGGVFPISKVDGPPDPVPGANLTPPVLEAEAARDAAFAEAWAARPDVELDRPVHEFVQWLTGRDEVIFHGSTRCDIEVFEPRRESMEINNVGGHGNLGAVYGTHDGLWSMFFAIIDRNRLRGSIRNGVGTYVAADGRRLDLYRFSVDYRSLPLEPYTSGCLYVLPRSSFSRIPMFPGGPPSNEWACPDPVRPLARIPVEPADFPFLDRIGGHDDGDLVRLSEVAEEVLSKVGAVDEITDGYRLHLDGVDPGLRDEWLTLGRRYMPDVTRTVVDEGIVELTGPQAFVDTMRSRLSDHLD